MQWVCARMGFYVGMKGVAHVSCAMKIIGLFGEEE